jgi:hypothetical protein
MTERRTTTVGLLVDGVIAESNTAAFVVAHSRSFRFKKDISPNRGREQSFLLS